MKIEERQNKLFQRNNEKLIRKFQSFEQKVASLIELKLRVQKETLDTVSKELVSLRAEKKQEKHRILTLIERVDQMFLGID